MMRHQASDPAPPEAEVEPAPPLVPPLGLALTIARLVPWAVLIGHAIWLGSLALADGALALAFLMLPWVSLVALSRVEGR